MLLKVAVWLKTRMQLARHDDRGISAVEAGMIVVAAGAAALAFVALFTDATDGLEQDFRDTFGVD